MTSSTPPNSTSMGARTKHPVVLIHGVFGYGKQRPLWRRFAPYWPETALEKMNANHLIVDVGVLSSDHDRACEAFYQLYGGRVDYGHTHSMEHGHSQYGYTHDTPLHPHWSEHNPVHLLGHSFGATTAIELYQLLCQDYFRVGSNHKWVKSIISIAGPLSGTTLTHLFQLHDAKMVAFTLGHLIGAMLCLYQRLHTQIPILRKVFDYRMPQWENVPTYTEAASSTCRILASPDLAVYDIAPARRLERNSRLVQMDKPFLISIATSAHSKLPLAEMAGAGALLLGSLLLLVVAEFPGHGPSQVTSQAALCSGTFALVLGALWLVKRLSNLDFATLPCLTFLQVQMKFCVRFLHEIFDGFDHEEWEHNDGAVNVASMLFPLQMEKQLQSTMETETESDGDDSSSGSGSDADSVDSVASTVVTSSSMKASMKASRPLLTTHPLHLEAYGADAKSETRDAKAKNKPSSFQPGRWYVHQVAKNHLAGTHFDRDAPVLYERLLHLLATEME